MGELHPDCQRVLKEVRQFLDNELDTASSDAIREHLAACEPCMDEAEIESAIRTLVRESCLKDRAPVDLRAKLKASMLSWTEQPPITEAG